MKILRESSRDEYFKFYLERERRKSRSQEPVPATPDRRIREMERDHRDKILPYRGHVATAWHLVALNSEDFGRLLFYDDAGAGADSWTRPFVDDYKAQADYRLLRNVAARPKAQASVKESHYYAEMQQGKWVPLQGDNKIALRTLVHNEGDRNPSAKYYVHDGTGRCLAYMVLILQEKLRFEPVEAFLCEQACR